MFQFAAFLYVVLLLLAPHPASAQMSLADVRAQAENGNATAQYVLGGNYLLGKGGAAKDQYEGFRWLKISAENGHSKAPGDLCWMYESGTGTKPNIPEAIKWCDKAIELDDARGYAPLGYIYSMGKGVAPDQKRAFEYYQRGADLGNSIAQNNLGAMYRDGLYTKKDLNKALHWFQLSAEQGYNLAKFNVALLYDAYLPPAADSKKNAFEWYKKAAESGYPKAQENLAWAYQKGLGTNVDLKKAFDWYVRAAEQGLAESQNSVGFFLVQGMGVKQDYKQAASWYYKAAGQGYALAMANLGEMYEKGLGVEKDIEEAKRLYAASAKAGNQNAENYLNKLNASAKPSGPETVTITQVRTKPFSPKAGTPFKVVTQYKVANPSIKTGKLPVTLQYSISQNGRSLFTSPEISIKAANGKEMRRTQRLTATASAGKYLLEFRVAYQGQTVSETAALNISQ